MNDLEITRLCAEAMGYTVVLDQPGFKHTLIVDDLASGYCPLHDDAQAMALVKKFGLELTLMINGQWRASYFDDDVVFSSDDLNRAICECVAKMMESKRVAL